jgi:hypothetical protein
VSEENHFRSTGKLNGDCRAKQVETLLQAVIDWRGCKSGH